MDFEKESLIYPRRYKPDDRQDWTGRIIQGMRRNQKLAEEQRAKKRNG
ncbi:hypothetical protein [Mangrovibacter sp. MFB070]|nr:hypothetical protein [Mangrovibacter sp. MFB070]